MILAHFTCISSIIRKMISVFPYISLWSRMHPLKRVNFCDLGYLSTIKLTVADYNTKQHQEW